MSQPGAGIMKLLRVALPTAILTIVPGLTAHAQGVAVSKQELDAKLAYCKTCHGANGRDIMAPIPSRALPGSRPSISRTSCTLLSTAGGRTDSCIAWRTC